MSKSLLTLVLQTAYTIFFFCMKEKVYNLNSYSGEILFFYRVCLCIFCRSSFKCTTTWFLARNKGDTRLLIL